MSDLIKEDERLDDLERNGLVLLQNPEMFCFGIDAVLLAHFVKVKEGERVLDIGTGTGIIPILLTSLTRGSSFTGLEIQEKMAEMASRSVALNHLEDKVKIVNGDIKASAELFGKDCFDVVISNPPYMAENHGLKNPSAPVAIARHEISCSLHDIIFQSSRLLKTGGRMYMVHRPNRLTGIIAEMRALKIEPKHLRMVHSFSDSEAVMVLIEGVKGGGAFMKVDSPLIIYEKPGVYTPEVRKYYE